MKTLSARVIDPTHLELLEPISTKAGERLEIVIPATDAEDADWRQAARDSFLDAYDDQDAIYDEL
jgi:hypothetical protein